MRDLGRKLQGLGLIMAPLAIVLQTTGAFDKGWQELAFLGASVCVFCMGWVLQGLGSA